jgi:hypothetical protein
MPAKITKGILESHLNCRYKSYLQLAGESGCTSDYELLLKESMERVRRAAATQLVRDKNLHVLRDVVGTSAVLKRGVDLLLDVTLEDSQSNIRFDCLQKSPGSSRLGDFHYIPLLVHESERPGRVAKGMLDLLAITLTSIQGTAPQWGIHDSWPQM